MVGKSTSFPSRRRHHAGVIIQLGLECPGLFTIGRTFPCNMGGMSPTTTNASADTFRSNATFFGKFFSHDVSFGY